MKFCPLNHDYHPLSYKQEHITINSISFPSDIIAQKNSGIFNHISLQNSETTGLNKLLCFEAVLKETKDYKINLSLSVPLRLLNSREICRSSFSLNKLMN